MSDFKSFFQVGEKFVVSKDDIKFIGTVVDNDSDAETVYVKINKIINGPINYGDEEFNEGDILENSSPLYWDFKPYNSEPLPAGGGKKLKKRRSKKVKRRSKKRRTNRRRY